MFCDLVNSTGLSERLDPEDLREVMQKYDQSCGSIINRCGGTIGRFLGDGVLAYFGYPVAHEDDAARAVRAGLHVAKAISELRPHYGVTLQVRVGIATGTVVIEPPTHPAVKGEFPVIGQAPNRAARLQSLAAPGTVLIADTTRRLAGEFFEYQNCGMQRIRGFAKAERLWRVLSERPGVGRFAAMRGGGLSRFIGRKAELSQILGYWEQVKKGQGLIVGVSGQPGIGKSRICQVLLNNILRQNHRCITLNCSPDHTNTAFYPIVAYLGGLAKFLARDSSHDRSRKINKLLDELGERDRQSRKLIADLLHGSTSEENEPNKKRKKQNTLRALTAQLIRIASSSAIVVVFEDVHWIDPSTTEFLDLLRTHLPSLPILVLCTFRSNSGLALEDKFFVEILNLEPFAIQDSIALIKSLLPDQAIPRVLLDQIAAKSDGIPLFIEELTKTIKTSGLLRKDGRRSVPQEPLPESAVPVTLQDAILARLESFKEVAQAAAVIGREFPLSLLISATNIPQARIVDTLDHMIAEGLVFPKRSSAEPSFIFKHALVQDSAYSTLVRAQRRQLHARVGLALEAHFEETKTEPEILARHFTEAGDTAKAVDYWLMAGQQAIRRSADIEAIAHLKKGLAGLRGMAPSKVVRERELSLQAALGASLMALKGPASSETGAAFSRGLELCGRSASPPQVFPTLYGLVSHHLVRAEFQQARRLAEQFLKRARNSNNVAMELVGHRLLAPPLFHECKLCAARDHLEKVLGLYVDADHRSLAFEYPPDLRTAGLTYLSRTLFLQGYLDQAAQAEDEAIDHAERLNHLHTTAYAFAQFPFALPTGLRLDKVKRRIKKSLKIMREQGSPFLAAHVNLYQGAILVEDGFIKDGAKIISKATEVMRRAGASLWLPYVLTLGAEVLAKAGERETAISFATEGLELALVTKSNWIVSELYRVKGEALRLNGRRSRSEATATLRKAFEIAQRREAKLWELRAATCFARVLCESGQKQEASDILTPIYGWFVEGFESVASTEARQVLAEAR
jgi:class 3 adenylate cyclase/predicted ATPase